MPGGTKSIWPFRAGRFIELPYTLPQDHVLFITLAEQSNTIWKKKTEWLIQHRGMACLITHPEQLERRLMNTTGNDAMDEGTDFRAIVVKALRAYLATPLKGGRTR